MSAESIDTQNEITPAVLNRDPTIVSGVLAVLASVIAAVLIVPFFLLAIPFGIAGVLFVTIGVFSQGSRSWVSLGVASLFLAVLLVGALSLAPPLILVGGAIAVFVTWDIGQHAISIGEQFGRQAQTQRGEIVHAAASGLVGVISAGVLYGIYSIATGDQPALAVFLLILGTVGLVWALRD